MSTTIVVSERERAKRIINAIIRQVGGRLTSKTELVRVFWRAHLVYAQSQPGFLSFWPLLKTAAGPVIKDVDLLLGELVAEGVLQFDETVAGGVTGLRLKLTEPAAAGGEMPGEAVEAIEKAIAVPGEPVNLAEYDSLRSWNEASDGEELNIYLDVIPDDEYADRKQRLQDMTSVLKSVWD